MNTTNIERSATNHLTLVTDYNYPNKVKQKLQQEQEDNYVYVAVITSSPYDYFNHVTVFDNKDSAYRYINYIKTQDEEGDYQGVVKKEFVFTSP